MLAFPSSWLCLVPGSRQNLLRLLCLLFLFSHLSLAGDKDGSSQRKPDLLDKKIRLFCKGLANSDIPGAVGEIVVLEKHASFAENITKTMVAARRDMERGYGRFTGKVELVSEDYSGDSYRRFTIAEKYEQSMLAYRLTFYRVQEDWKLEWLVWKSGDAWVEKSKLPPERFEGAMKLANEIMHFINEEKYAEAGDFMREHATKRMASVWNPKSMEEVTLRQKIAALNANTSLGAYECVGTESLGSSLVRFRFVQKLREIGNSWSFSFYRAENDWKLIEATFRLDHRDLDYFEQESELEESFASEEPAP